MTQQRALEIIKWYWGAGESVPISVINEIESAWNGKDWGPETLLGMVSAMADIYIEVKRVKPFDCWAIYRLADKKLAEMAFAKSIE